MERRNDNDKMQVGDNIFVYGTLKRGHGANRFMEGKSDFICEDRINATMYGLGGYPGIKVVDVGETGEQPASFISEGPTVKGELYRITDEDLPPRLDAYEGYPSLYSRRCVRTESGELTWVYHYNGYEDRDRLIPEGIWG